VRAEILFKAVCRRHWIGGELVFDWVTDVFSPLVGSTSGHCSAPKVKVLKFD